MSDIQPTTMAELRSFLAWEEPSVSEAVQHGFTRGVIPDDTPVFVDRDLKVHLPGSRVPLLKDQRADWALFCQEQLQVENEIWPNFTRHPLNQDFLWRSVGRGKRVLSDAEAQQYDKLGYVVLEDVLDSGFLAELTSALDNNDDARIDALKRAGDTKNISRDGQISFNIQPSKRSSTIRDLTTLPVLQHIAFDLIGPNVRLYWDQSVYKRGNCADPFPWHQDTGYTFTDYQQFFTLWIALTDANVDSGCLWVLPGAHRVGTLEHVRTDLGNTVFDTDPKGMVPLPVKAGSIVAFTAVLPHMTGGNDQEWTRKALVVEYAPDGMKRIALDPWGNQVQSLANSPETQYEVLRNGRPVGHPGPV